MGFLVLSAEAEVLFVAGVNLPKNSGDGGHSPVLLSPRGWYICPMLKVRETSLTNNGETPKRYL